MFCFIYRWMISWSLDSAKPLPGLVNRHIGHCQDCRELARSSRELKDRLTREAHGLPRQDHDCLEGRIIAALGEKPKPDLSLRRRFSFKPLPAFAAVLVTVVVLVGLVIRFNPKASSPGAGSPNNGPLEDVSIRAPLQRFASGVESPMETEILNLRQSISSAAEFLASCLEVKIGQQ